MVPQLLVLMVVQILTNTKTRTMYLIKKISFCFLFIGFSFSLFGQVTLTQVEYFWDTDPGEGNGIVISAVDGNYNTILENIVANAIATPAATGLHTFNVRAQDSSGNWGPVNTQVIELSTALLSGNALAPVANVEYFWDTDPGEGNGIALAAEDGNYDTLLESILEGGIAVPGTTGIHSFNIRAQDSNGDWGAVHTQMIDLSAALLGANALVSLSNAEYFWDADPGEGSGIAFAAEDGNYDTILEQILKNDVAIVGPVAVHSFNIRVQDSNGNWGPIHTQVIDIEAVLSVTENENAAIQLKLFPNPSKDYFILDFEKDLIIERVEIYNLLGKQVLSSDFEGLHSQNEIRVEINNLAMASYIVKIRTNKGVTSKVLIKKN